MCATGKHNWPTDKFKVAMEKLTTYDISLRLLCLKTDKSPS